MRLFLAFTISIFFLHLHAFSQSNKSLPGTDVQGLKNLAEKLKIERAANLEKAVEVAGLQDIPIRTVEEDGTIIELQGITETGELLFYITENLDAAKTVSTDKVWPSGGLGYNLTGDSMVVGEWDGGAVRATHQELSGRITQKDGSTNIINHATHVAGTMIATGVVAAAKGMAYKAKIDAYDWNSDLSEMATAASNGLLISNHSYGWILGFRLNPSRGWEWWGNTSISTTEDYRFGFYSSYAQDRDQLARDAPYYLICKSAGNDRGDYTSGTYFLGSSITTSSVPRDPDGGSTGYDCVGDVGSAKNILTVGAVNAISSGYSVPTDVVMSSFSGWGPTDDGRIKPDIVANGVGVYSSLGSGNSDYASWNGTSMSSPSAAGSILLIQQHFKNTIGNYGKAATIKGLVLHTADEAGSNPGPDYSFGWGLLNTASAVEHITNTNGKNEIIEASINNGGTYELNVTSDGNSPFWVTISWTDVAGIPVAASLDPTNLMLVNDLDVRIIYNDVPTTYMPYILDPNSPASAATTGDNFRDNVEQVYIANPSSGSYTILVNYKGNIIGGSQDFTIISSGAVVDVAPKSCGVTVKAFPYNRNFESYSLCTSVPASSCQLSAVIGWENLNNDSIDWVVNSGSTPTSNTGPNVDYNPGTASGKYLYLEASGAGSPLKTAVLQSPCFNISNVIGPELSFAYHMNGSNMGSLRCEINDGHHWNTIWHQSGSQGSGWNTVNIDLTTYAKDTIQIRFIGITGNGALSDMGLDDFEIVSNTLNCTKTIDVFPYNEDFETFTNCSTSSGSSCDLPFSSGWVNNTTDDIDWTVNNGGTPSSGTGPSADFTTKTIAGRYLYTEASITGVGPGSPSKEAILEGPCFDLVKLRNTELSFAYHMLGANVGSLIVEVDSGNGWQQEWDTSGNLGSNWLTKQIDLSVYDGKKIKLRFRGITGSNWSSDIAIDDIQIKEIIIPDFISAQSGDWDSGTSWVGGTAPSKLFHNVLIKSGHNITLANNEAANNLTIESTGTITLSGNEMKLSGNLTINGNIDNTGNMLFAGSNIQSISGVNTVFNSLSFINPNGTYIESGSHSISSTINISNGIFNTNNSLTLLSDANGTASLSEIIGGGISGDVTVQRYLNESSSAFWYMIGSPVTGSSLADWNNEIFMGGFPGSNNPSWGATVYKYDIGSISINGNYGEGYVAPTNVTNNLIPGEGWMVWLGSSPQIVDVIGPLNTGLEFVSIPYNTNPTGGETKRGWALVANPYPAPIEWATVSKFNLETAEAYTSKPDGNYWAVISDNIDTIYSGEGFWVQGNAGGGLLTFLESNKVVGKDGYNLRKAAKPVFSNTLKLELSYASKPNYMDYSVLRFGGDSNSVDFDRVYGEALKVPNSYGTVANIATYSYLDNAEIYYNTLNPEDSNWIMPLYVWKTYPQSKNETYTVEFNGIESWADNNRCLILTDSLNNTSIKLDKINHDYSWMVYDTIKRKYLYLKHSIPLEVSVVNTTCYGFSDGSITVNGSGSGKHTYIWFDENENIIKKEIDVFSGSTLKNLKAGTYKIMVDNNGDCGTMGATIVVSQPDPIIADFNSDVDTVWLNANTTIYFTNSSLETDAYHWDFGDGNTSDLENPEHTYMSGGEFIVTMVAMKGPCTDTVEKAIIVVNNVSVQEVSNHKEEKVRIYQQGDNTYVEVNFNQKTDIVISMNDILGREIMSPLRLQKVLQKRIELNVPANTTGIHIIKVDYDNEKVVEKLYYHD